MRESLLPSNSEHVERAVEAVMRTNKRKIAQLGLSFKAGTDDLRESPQVQLVKRLLGEGYELKVWDIGSLLSADLEDELKWGDVIIIGNKSAKKDVLSKYLRKDQIVIDLVNLDKARRPHSTSSYEGICW